jgi:hypothetical protein
MWLNLDVESLIRAAKFITDEAVEEKYPRKLSARGVDYR